MIGRMHDEVYERVGWGFVRSYDSDITLFRQFRIRNVNEDESKESWE